VAFWGKLGIAVVAISNISKKLPDVNFSLFERSCDFSESVFPLRPVNHQEYILLVTYFEAGIEKIL
jgi:hypothetical protein